MKKNEKKTDEKKATNEFKQFSGKYGNPAIEMSGRIYPAKEKNGIKRSFMYLEFASGFQIQATFVETSDNYFISFPQYETNDSYKSYVWVKKDSDFSNALDDLSDDLFHHYK